MGVTAIGHPFDFLPIGDAIDWLDVMSTKDSGQLLLFCQKRLENVEKHYASPRYQSLRDVLAKEKK